jgi:hypothetical protein
MTITDFRVTAAAFMNRTTTDLTIGGVDLVLASMNMAKAYAQRVHDFKQARGVAFISTTDIGAELTTGAMTTYSGATVQPIKRVEGAWLYTLSGTTPRRANPIEKLDFGEINDFFSPASTTDAVTTVPQSPISLRWYIQGTKLYLMGSSTAVSVWLDVFKLLPDYVAGDTVTDFFHVIGVDWLLLKTCDYLNIHMKEDQRVLISKSRLDEAWNTLLTHDESYSG